MTTGSLEGALEKLQHWQPDENTFKQNVKAWYEHRDQPPLGLGRVRAVVERKSKGGQHGVSDETGCTQGVPELNSRIFRGS
jgi:hypothetical protein